MEAAELEPLGYSNGFTSNDTGDMSFVSGSSNTDEFQQLLEEIPRATSAPPHLDGEAGAVQYSNGAYTMSRETPYVNSRFMMGSDQSRYPQEASAGSTTGHNHLGSQGDQNHLSSLLSDSDGNGMRMGRTSQVAFQQKHLMNPAGSGVGNFSLDGPPGSQGLMMQQIGSLSMSSMQNIGGEDSRGGRGHYGPAESNSGRYPSASAGASQTISLPRQGSNSFHHPNSSNLSNNFSIDEMAQGMESLSMTGNQGHSVSSELDSNGQFYGQQHPHHHTAMGPLERPSSEPPRMNRSQSLSEIPANIIQNPQVASVVAAAVAAATYAAPGMHPDRIAAAASAAAMAAMNPQTGATGPPVYPPNGSTTSIPGVNQQTVDQYLALMAASGTLPAPTQSGNSQAHIAATIAAVSALNRGGGPPFSSTGAPPIPHQMRQNGTHPNMYPMQPREENWKGVNGRESQHIHENWHERQSNGRRSRSQRRRETRGEGYRGDKGTERSHGHGYHMHHGYHGQNFGQSQHHEDMPGQDINTIGLQSTRGNGSISHKPVAVSNEINQKVDWNDKETTMKYGSLEEVIGRIFLIAKDQHGCRFLQKLFDEGDKEVICTIFGEIVEHMEDLMTDPFGNYLIQKLLECCTEDQRTAIIDQVQTSLVEISLNMHGTRAVQKLIETISNEEQVQKVTQSLKPGVVTLVKDLNGNHVIQRCLQKLDHTASQFIYDVAAENCVEIATHRHGCCVLQRCVDYASTEQQQRLATEIAKNAFQLSQDPFGNYVVQYILELSSQPASSLVIRHLKGSYGYLASQKFSSNVVEKCLKLGPAEYKDAIVKELAEDPNLEQLLQDPYANYVIQSALSVAQGPLYNFISEKIKPHVPQLRMSPHGKRILQKLYHPRR